MSDGKQGSGTPLDDATRVEDDAQLLDWFRAGEKPVQRWRVGTEHEKIGLYEDTLDRVTYDGKRGIGALLEAVRKTGEWEPIMDGDHLVGLRQGGASITLEPGGQIELSGAPLRTARETCREFNAHVDLLNAVSREFGMLWLGIGADPLHPVSEIPKMPKQRYDIMRAYLPTRGKLGLDMMYATATVQANYDYADEADMAAKMRMAMGIAPLCSALFANSPIVAGRDTGLISYRVSVWRDTDPDRCGLLEFVFDEGFGYRDYLEWALDVPMFFVVRDGRYTPASSTTFRQFMESGFEGEHATLGDWNTHLTTLFPEVRLKQIIEVRSADSVPRDLICALPVLYKGLFYDPQARAEATALGAEWSPGQRAEALVAVARDGLGARVAGHSVLEMAEALVEISAGGLSRLVQPGLADDDEDIFLTPLRAALEVGKSPGQEILEAWRGEWAGDLRRLIEHARY
jgi:glutamate--cysteine ligase